MIVGSGDIGSAIDDIPRALIHVSGVSNSRFIDNYHKDETYREMSSIQSYCKENPSAHFIYLSSLSIYEKISPYTEHKRMMEKAVIGHSSSCSILRIGNITWGKNPHTIINFFRNNPNARVEDVYRYLITLDELNYWIRKAYEEKIPELNITGERVKAQEIMDRVKDGRL